MSEAQNTESKNDFIHKMKVAAKEADETEYWMLLFKYSRLLPSPQEKLEDDNKTLIKIISKIISSSKA